MLFLSFVKADNGHNIWNEEGASVDITVLPPWWRTSGAYFIYILALLGSLVMIYKTQINRVKLRNQLEYEQKEAERLLELDQLKTNLFSNITHEFRTPLTLIIEPARQLLQKWNGQEEEGTLRTIKRNGEKLLDLINQLLDLSKLESNKMELNWIKGDITQVIQPILASFEELVKQKDLQFHYQEKEDIPVLFFDRYKVEKILRNLLSNAYKFTDTGGITLSISDTSTQLVLKVKDTGRGIPKKELPYIFDKFYQAGNSNTPTANGTGIGLALTKELTELMQGTIEVESQLDQGTTFTIKFPLTLEMEVSSRVTTNTQAPVSFNAIQPLPVLALSLIHI